MDTSPADAHPTVGDTGDGEMAFPFLAAAALGYVGSGFLGSAYSTGRSYLASRENSQYWKDYERNTGVRVRYKYRSGYHYDYGRMLGGMQGMSGYGGSLYTHFDRW